MGWSVRVHRVILTGLPGRQGEKGNTRLLTWFFFSEGERGRVLLLPAGGAQDIWVPISRAPCSRYRVGSSQGWLAPNFQGARRTASKEAKGCLCVRVCRSWPGAEWRFALLACPPRQKARLLCPGSALWPLPDSAPRRPPFPSQPSQVSGAPGEGSGRAPFCR